jgi:hypothetical protein
LLYDLVLHRPDILKLIVDFVYRGSDLFNVLILRRKLLLKFLVLVFEFGLVASGEHKKNRDGNDFARTHFSFSFQ